MQVQEAQVQELTQDPDNSRSHDRKNLEAIKQSLEAFGQQKPIVIDHQGKVIAGNGTLQAAQELGWQTIQAVVTDLEGAKQTAYAIADNRTAELAAWNDEQLAKSLVSLQNDDSIDEAISGFDTKEIDKMVQSIAAQSEVVEDEIPEHVEPVTKLGDLWQLGRHRLLCGDSTKPEEVDRLMRQEKAAMVFTDPPYALFGNSTGVGKIADDKMVRPFFRQVLAECRRVTRPQGHVYLCCDWHSAMTIEAMGREVKLAAKNLIVWDKGDGGVGGMYQNCHELVWFFANSPEQTTTIKTSAAERPVNGVPNIWRFSRIPTAEREHNAAKPVEMIKVPVGASSDTGDTVLDLFAGSGSTLIAADDLKRTFYGMEIDPRYCDVIIKRWENLTGETAERLEG
jgi:DNA modification methylase